MKSHSITQVDIAKTLVCLKKNNFNYNKTASETGFHRTTIKRWFEKDGVAVLNKNSIQDVIRDADEDLEKKKIRITKKALDLKEDIIDRMSEVLPNSKDIEGLARSLKILDDLEKDKENKPKADVVNNSLTFIQHIEQQIKAKKSGSKND
jgi:hypothetical protein